MIILEGKNLCERQKELNLKVKEAVTNKVDFQEVKSAKESSDIDRLFKIDLASKYKNVDYLIEELKCGDSLYISRVLKCDWIYGNEYAHIINPDYLHHNIFPTMSMKMKSKTLSTISVHVRDETRAELFYEYCKNAHMNGHAHKFLIFTSVSCRHDFLIKEDNFGHIGGGKWVGLTDYKDLIGDSFVLADVFGNEGGKLSELPHLYSANEIEYLNLFEKHTKVDEDYFQYAPFGSKMSRSILKKHKSRVLNNPGPYLRVLKKSELIKYTSSDDARIYAEYLMPKKVTRFWRNDYYKKFKYILDLIKPNIYEFMKQIFSNKYPNEKFEMSENFYTLKYYTLMTAKDRESWALMHLEKQTDIIPEDKDYMWYEYVEFSTAIKEIKKKISITTCADKRSSMLDTLAKSAKTQRELEELLDYVYERHVNERRDLKERFIQHVIENHEALQFDDACWTAFEKLLYSVGAYKWDSWRAETFRDLSSVYHIITKRKLPNDLIKHLNKTQMSNIHTITEKLCEEKKEFVYDYMFQFLISKIQDFESQDFNDKIRDQVRGYLRKLIELKKLYKKEGDYPEIALKYMNLDIDYFEMYIIKNKKSGSQENITEGFLIRCLKQDPNVILENFSLIEKKFNSDYEFRLNMLLKKIKIYFLKDIGKRYLDLCAKSLLSASTDSDIFGIRRALFQNVFTLFQLGDESQKIEFMDTHAPKSSKIDHIGADDYLLYTQEAICRFHCYSRPPVPLSKTMMYLKGDYVHMCNDMFHMYLSNLTPSLRAEFINFLLNSPLSIQKRGLRLAFRSFTSSARKELVMDMWRKTRNISLRSNIYKLTFQEVQNAEEGKTQMEFFELLKELTNDVHQDDDDAVFECFESREIPRHLRPSYLETAWKTVSALPEKRSNIRRRTKVVMEMEINVDIMDEAFVEALIKDYLLKRLVDRKLRPEKNPDIVEFNKAVFDLAAKYVITIPTELKQEKSLNVVRSIVKECFSNWNETQNTDQYIYQQFFKEFADKLESCYYGRGSTRVIPIFEYLLETFETRFGVKEIYSYYWDWKLSYITRTVISDRTDCNKEEYIRFGSELGMLVKELKGNQCYYTSFLQKILGKISKFIGTLTTFKPRSMNARYVKILIAYGLTRHHEMMETYVLALEILPQDLTDCVEDEPELLEVIEAVKKQNNDELTAFMNDKFIYTDLKVRKIGL